MVWAGLQWYEMHPGGADTATIANAANQQACAARRIAEASIRNASAAEGFATSAGLINTGIGNAVVKLEAQVRAVEESRKSSEAASTKSLNNSIEASRLDERAWMGVSEVLVSDSSKERGFPAAVVFVNSGKTAANNAETAAGYHYSATPVYGPSQSEIKNLIFHPVQSTAPQAKFNDVVGYLPATGDTSSPHDLAGNVDIQSHFNEISEGRLTLYYYGTLRYDDVFGRRRTTNFCIYLADAKRKIGAFCRDFNDLN
jgi:hypothetical protein